MRNLIAAVERIDPLVVSGRVAAVSGLLIEARGGLTRLAVGARAEIERRTGEPLPAEVVGFREARALLMPFGSLEGVAPGAEIRIAPEGACVRPTLAWKGRVIDAYGEPIDGKGPLPRGPAAYPLRAAPPPAHARGRVGARLDLGVLVDGDDHNAPIADAVRGILDGHIVMERAIAERGRFPAINVLKSISRTLPGCQLPHEREVVGEARRTLSAYADMEELIRIGAYRAGADPLVDRAIELNPALEAFLAQDKDEPSTLERAFIDLGAILAQRQELAA